MKKHTIEIKYSVYPDTDSLYPFYVLSSAPYIKSDKAILLSKEEMEDYKETMRKFNEWQTKIGNLIKRDMDPQVQKEYFPKDD